MVSTRRTRRGSGCRDAGLGQSLSPSRSSLGRCWRARSKPGRCGYGPIAVVFAASPQLLHMVTFPVIPIVGHRYGAATHGTGEVEAMKQGIPAGVLFDRRSASRPAIPATRSQWMTPVLATLALFNPTLMVSTAAWHGSATRSCSLVAADYRGSGVNRFGTSRQPQGSGNATVLRVEGRARRNHLRFV